jgi:4-hydroxybenzoate polyprenyltransferase
MKKVVFWAGVVAGIVAGLALIVGAIVTKHVALAAWGVTGVAGSIIAAVSGAKARPDGSISPPTIGAVFTEIPSGAWAVIALLFVASVVMTFIFPPFR